MTAPRILAIETSLREGSVALAEGDRLLAESPLSREQRTAQSLLPAIRELVDQAGLSLAELDLVAVSQGPGSFTGLRIGVTTAKTIAYAQQIDVLGVHTLEIIAARLLLIEPRVDSGQFLEVVLDAQRQQLFAARFRSQDGCLREEAATAIVDFTPWSESPPGNCQRAGVLPRWATENSPENRAFPFLTQPPDASALAWLAARRIANPQGWPPSPSAQACGSDSHDLFALAPVYFRRSAAEENQR